MVGDGRRRERYAEMLAAKQEPPLFINLVWTDYTRMANEIAAARVAKVASGGNRGGDGVTYSFVMPGLEPGIHV